MRSRAEVIRRARMRLEQLAIPTNELVSMFLKKMAENESYFFLDKKLGLIVSKKSNQDKIH